MSLLGKKQSDNSRPSFGFRYYFLLIIFLVGCVAILAKTFSITSDGAGSGGAIELKDGGATQMQVPAKRGDIVDSDGLPLAYSESQEMLYLADSGLDTSELNQMLLDYYQLLSEHHIPLAKGIEEYFTPEDGNAEKLNFKFVKDEKETTEWQAKDDLFDLKTPEDHTKGEAVKLDPKAFFDYLRYDKFEIENKKQTGDQRYTESEAWHIMQMRYLLLKQNWQFIQGQPILIAGPLTEDVKAILQEQNERFRGAQIVAQEERRYADDVSLFAHIVGYTGKISDAEYQHLGDQGYSPQDTVGKSGVEYSAERYLHGQAGTVPYQTWKLSKDRGEHTESDKFKQSTTGVEPIDGYTVQLTMNKKMQEITRNALLESEKMHHQYNLGKASALGAVMIDLRSGEVLAMDSLPSYNPQYFSLSDHDPQANKKIQEYLKDNINKPLINRCISEIYTPGSTFKPITSAAAIENGVIKPGNSIYVCNGTEEIADKEWSCYEKPVEGHGPIDLTTALVTSCNLYFYKLGLDTGIDNISAMARKLGLGEYTNIDLPNEVKGYVSSRELKRATREEPSDQEWYPADTCQTAIGQFDNSYTLLQLARAIGGIASNQLVTPHVIKQVTDNKGNVILAEKKDVQPLHLKKETQEMVSTGMRNLKNSGGYNTQYYFGNYSVDVSCKTGSAELVDRTGDKIIVNAMYVAYAPTDKPEVAVAIMVQDATAGDYLAPIARHMFDGYFGTDGIAPLNQTITAIEGE